MSTLNGKIALITGAAAGIGYATALRFARDGAHICGWDVSDTRAQEFAAAMQQAGGTGSLHAVNVTDAAAVSAAVARLIAEKGGVDILVNNAGIVRDAQLVKVAKDGTITPMKEEAWDAVIDVNLKGVFLATQAVVPHMIQRGGGAILNASSVVGLYGNFGQTNYVATKAGVIGMTKTWSRELGKYGIRVNAVAPGFIATEMVKAMPTDVLDKMKQRAPLGRLGTPEDIANAYAWLASEEASFVNGTVLSVDGGLVMGT